VLGASGVVAGTSGSATDDLLYMATRICEVNKRMVLDWRDIANIVGWTALAVWYFTH
jgi:hypothetical protein